jgi:hypothetical protein
MKPNESFDPTVIVLKAMELRECYKDEVNNIPVEPPIEIHVSSSSEPVVRKASPAQFKPKTFLEDLKKTMTPVFAPVFGGTQPTANQRRLDDGGSNRNSITSIKDVKSESVQKKANASSDVQSFDYSVLQKYASQMNLQICELEQVFLDCQSVLETLHSVDTKTVPSQQDANPVLDPKVNLPERVEAVQSRLQNSLVEFRRIQSCIARLGQGLPDSSNLSDIMKQRSSTPSLEPSELKSPQNIPATLQQLSADVHHSPNNAVSSLQSKKIQFPSTNDTRITSPGQSPPRLSVRPTSSIDQLVSSVEAFGVTSNASIVRPAEKLTVLFEPTSSSNDGIRRLAAKGFFDEQHESAAKSKLKNLLS